jgi:hypothetical protein
MLIRHYIYIALVFIIISAIASIVYSFFNKNKFNSKALILLNLFYVGYAAIDVILITFLNIDIGFQILLVNVVLFVAAILLFTSAIINRIRIRKGKLEYKKNKPMVIFTIIMLIIPLAIVEIPIIKDLVVMNNSKLLVVYRSRGNGGIGDSKYFGYAIGDDYCIQFDVGTDSGGSSLDNYIPSSSERISYDSKLKGYEIKFDNNKIIVTKDGKKICESKTKEHYFNNHFNVAYFIK